jgi:outer membrane lipoprotein-sorting protein
VNRFRTAFLTVAVAMAATAALAAGAPTPLSAEDQALEAKGSAYLQTLTSAEGRFTQTDARGAVTHGAFYLQRPGKIRFEYDPPSSQLVVSDGHNVTVYDKRLNSFSAYPLGFTPLHVFLAKTIRLDRDAAVDRVARTAEGFEITARDAHHLHEGSITLAFSESPMRLTEWTIVDGRGQRTRVQLTSLKPTGALDSKLFVITAPARKGR